MREDAPNLRVRESGKHSRAMGSLIQSSTYEVDDNNLGQSIDSKVATRRYSKRFFEQSVEHMPKALEVLQFDVHAVWKALPKNRSEGARELDRGTDELRTVFFTRLKTVLHLKRKE